MYRKCPSCGGDNVRRSSTPASEVTWRNQVLSRYRCRDCMLQFWVISRKAYVAGASIVVAIAVIVIAVFLLDLVQPGNSPGKDLVGPMRGSPR